MSPILVTQFRTMSDQKTLRKVRRRILREPAPAVGDVVEKAIGTLEEQGILVSGVKEVDRSFLFERFKNRAQCRMYSEVYRFNPVIFKSFLGVSSSHAPFGHVTHMPSEINEMVLMRYLSELKHREKALDDFSIMILKKKILFLMKEIGLKNCCDEVVGLWNDLFNKDVRLIYSSCELLDYFKSVRDFYGYYPQFTLTKIFDGIRFYLNYNAQGVLTDAVADGGFNISGLPGIPGKISLGIRRVYGTLTMSKSELDDFNTKRAASGQSVFSSVKPLVSYVLRTPNPFLQNGLRVMFDEVEFSHLRSFKKLSGALNALPSSSSSFSFTLFPDKEKEILRVFTNSLQGEMKFPVTGIKLRINDFEEADRLKKVRDLKEAHYFFPWTCSNKSELANIFFRVWSTGLIIAKASIFPSVKVAGKTLSNLTLRNENGLQTLRERPFLLARTNAGNIDFISCYRSEDKLSKVSAVEYPKSCPQCKAPLKKLNADGEVIHYCSSHLLCAGNKKEIGKIINFLKAINIKSLTDDDIKHLIDNHALSEFSDIFKLTEDNFVNMEENKKREIMSEIEYAKRSVELSDFICALGIEGIDGFDKTSAKKIAQVIGTASNLTALSAELLLKKGVDKSKVNALIEYFSDPKNKEQTKLLLKNMEVAGLDEEIVNLCNQKHTKEQYKNIKKYLNEADKKFNIGDSEYDLLLITLQEIENKGYNWIEFDEVSRDKKLVGHKDYFWEASKKRKTRDVQEMQEMLLDVKNLLVQPKLDGVAMTLKYDMGKLVGAFTRLAKLDVLSRVRRFAKIPEYLNDTFTGEVRGELVISKENECLLEDKTPGSVLIGGLLSKVPYSKDITSLIEFFAYHIQAKDLNIPVNEFPSYINNLGLVALEGQFFTIDDNTSLKSVVNYGTDQNARESESLFRTDGMVLRTDEKTFYFKFTHPNFVSKLEGVAYGIRKGTLYATLKISPIKHGGKTHTAISIWNPVATLKGMRIGDEVSIRFIGDSPSLQFSEDFAHFNKKKREGYKLEFPEKCPLCSGPLVTQENEVVKCPSAYCKSLVTSYELKEFARNIGISNFSRTIEKLFKAKLLLEKSDFWLLSEESLEKARVKTGLTEIEEKNLLCEIECSKNNSTLKEILTAFKLKGITQKYIEAITRSSVSSLLNLLNMTVEDLSKIEGISFQSAKKIAQLFADKDHEIHHFCMQCQNSGSVSEEHKKSLSVNRKSILLESKIVKFNEQLKQDLIKQDLEIEGFLKIVGELEDGKEKTQMLSCWKDRLASVEKMLELLGPRKLEDLSSEEFVEMTDGTY